MQGALMAGLAFYIKLHRLFTFIFMPIVTAQTCHLAIPETLTGRKHAVLIAVYVHFRNRLSRILPKEVEQPIAGLKAE